MRKTLFIKLLEELGIPNKWSKLNSEFTLEPKNEFRKKIRAHYAAFALDTIPKEIIEDISQIITNDLHNRYRKSWRKYPKSRKRYSVLEMKDLKHPHIYRLIMEYLKTNHPIEYSKYSCILLGMDKAELKEEEKRQFQFFNK